MKDLYIQERAEIKPSRFRYLPNVVDFQVVINSGNIRSLSTKSIKIQAKAKVSSLFISVPLTFQILLVWKK